MDVPEISGALAIAFLDEEGRHAQITLNKDWGEDPCDATSDYNIRKIAFHEVWEINLWEIHKALNQVHPANIAAQIAHDVIIQLQNTMFDESYEKRFPKEEEE